MPIKLGNRGEARLKETVKIFPHAILCLRKEWNLI